ncbi:MAG TPA: glucosyl-3-phosphoglycerate synthase [Anaerolineae bacterium]|nr:glucosyl-3-phosphoglycerate synthase [Anaerolineae bacterium]
MMVKDRVDYLRTVWVPILQGCEYESALKAACLLATDVVLVGVVRVPPDQPLSAGAYEARQVRRLLRALSAGEQVRYKARVLVSHQPWTDLTKAITADEPDLLLLDWPCHIDALHVTAAEVLTRPPCDVALVRGPLPDQIKQVLIPMRGGPHAELALRVSLSTQPHDLVALHLTSQDAAESDVPFHGLAQTLKNLPEVQMRSAATIDAAQTILEQAQQADLIVMGATAQPLRSKITLGEVADRVLKEARGAVIAVKTRRPMPQPGEVAGSQAISIVVDKWFAQNTYHADEFRQIDRLVALKQEQGVSISLALPALDEEKTVGHVIQTLKHALLDKAPLLDEIVLIDSNSTDRTRLIAAELGLPVFIHQELLPQLGARKGKGEALWKSLLVTRGDIIVWIDTDIVNIHPRFVYGVLGPMLVDPQIQLVKGFYRRPLKVGDKLQAGGGGRVTELTVRPLLNLFYPELSGVIQPLSGEYGGRRSALEQLPFYSGYGVEAGLLIGMYEKFGLNSIAQSDLLERIHHSQSLEALSKMSFAILQTVVRKLEQRYHLAMLEDVNKSMKLIRHKRGTYFLDVEEIAEYERPPMLEIADYRKWMKEVEQKT